MTPLILDARARVFLGPCSLVIGFFIFAQLCFYFAECRIQLDIGDLHHCACMAISGAFVVAVSVAVSLRRQL